MVALRLTRSARTAVVLAAAGFALAGCSAHPGAAAVVDGEYITTQEVSAAGSDYEAVTGQEVNPGAVAYTLVDAEFINDIAAEYGLAFSDDQVVDFFTEQADTAGGQVPDDGFSPASIELGRSLMVSSQLRGHEDVQAIVEDYTAARDAAEVEMNPRYGQLVDGQLASIDREWIAAAGQ